jgi:hypothetical protein
MTGVSLRRLLLALSLGLNVALALVLGTRRVRSWDAAGATPPLPIVETKHRRSPPVRLSCAGMLADTRARIDTLKNLMTSGRQLSSRWDKGPANAQLAALASPEITRIFQSHGAAPPALDCRGMICAFVTDVNLGEVSHWGAQDPWMRRHLSKIQIRPGAKRVYLSLLGDADPWGPDVLRRLAAEFKSSGALEACRASQARTGSLEASLRIEAVADRGEDQAGVQASFHGSLAGTPVGNCVAERFYEWLRAHPPPPDATLAQIEVPFI